MKKREERINCTKNWPILKLLEGENKQISISPIFL
jgi:hypothetical protein